MTKHEVITDAAQQVFLRYGIQKTTMADIAEAAGLSRQTVYNLFENKEAVLRSVITSYAQETVERMVTAWDAADNLGDVLDAFIENVPVAWFNFIAASPNAGELIEGLNNVSKEEEDKFNAYVIDALLPHLIRFVPDLGRDAAKAASFADFVFTTLKHTKHGAGNLETLQRRAGLQRQAILAMVAAGL